MNWSHLELPPSQWGQLSQESSQIGTRLPLQVITSPNWTRPPAWPRLPAPSVVRLTRLYLWLNCLTMHILVPWPQFFCLFKPIAHVCIPKMAEDELSAYCSSSHSIPEPCNKPPFSVFTMPLYLVFRGRRLDLAYGISGVWALGPKLQFHYERTSLDSWQLCKSFLVTPILYSWERHCLPTNV
jgi:hypothetical protein